MKKSKVYIIFLFSILFNISYVIGQMDEDQHDVFFTIPEISLLDIEPDNSTITLTFNQPTDGGAPISPSAQNNTKWINYSNSLSPTASNRNIYVEITNGTIPSGLDLKLQANPYSGIGQGSFGTPMGQIAINNTPQLLISNIGASYTGDGSTNGHQLIYSLSFDQQYGLLDADASATIEVTYTITN